MNTVRVLSIKSCQILAFIFFKTLTFLRYYVSLEITSSFADCQISFIHINFLVFSRCIQLDDSKFHVR